MAGHADDIQTHIRLYMMVFGSLLVLTIITVGVSYLHLSIGKAVAIALAVAAVKGSLVALFFMHLSSEVITIYRVLLLTGIFFFTLMTLPTSWWSEEMKAPSVWTVQVPASHAEAEHGGH